MAPPQWSPSNRRHAREQADSNGYLQKHHRGKRIKSGRFSITDLTSGDTSSKSARPAKDFESCETVSIAESAQCPLVRCLAQLVNHESTQMNTNRRCSGGCVSRKSLNLAISCNTDSSRGEFGFKAGRSAESPRVCSGGKRESLDPR